MSTRLANFLKIFGPFVRSVLYTTTVVVLRTQTVYLVPGFSSLSLSLSLSLCSFPRYVQYVSVSLATHTLGEKVTEEDWVLLQYVLYMRGYLESLVFPPPPDGEGRDTLLLLID